ncbi:hypothetical protein KC887_05400 [Candidatus Kaiserbacteria bacterium]|nr:hypothetical protein [Candidatus Kaiserbacteria bacterium]
MKKIVLVLALVAFMGSVSAPATAYADCSYNGWLHSGGKCGKSWEKKEKSYKYERDDDNEDDDDDTYNRNRSPYSWNYSSQADLQDYIDYLLELIQKLEDQRDNINNKDQDPVATTQNATNIQNDEARLRGSVDMNDFRNGRVFFIYGEDEGQVDDARDENRYSDIDEDGSDLQKVTVDSDLDSSDSYTETVTNLDDNTAHYFAICVEYEDDNGDDTLECGTVRTFETD